jgi:DNA primase
LGTLKKISKAEIKGLKHLANNNIVRVFQALGIAVQERYQYIVGPCPIHEGDRTDAFSWHLELGIYQCFTKGCHDTYGKDVFGLVRGVLKCTFLESVNFINKLFNDGNVDLSLLAAIDSTKQFVEASLAVTAPEKTFPEEVLNRLKYHNYLETRGYPRDIVERYQIGIPSDNFGLMSHRVIFPIRNIEGKLVGFSGRTLYPDWKERGIGKWHHSKGFRKEANLFNIDKAKRYIEETGSVIITEGPLDVLRFEHAGIHNSVAIFGRKLHNKQITLLMTAGAARLIVALDSDIAGQTGAEDAFNNASAFFTVNKVKLPTKDVGEMSVEDVRKVFAA